MAAWPSPNFAQWMQRELNAVEHTSLSKIIERFDRDGIDVHDADGYGFDPEEAVASRRFTDLRFKVFLQPHRISTAVRQGKTLWLGMIRVTQGPPQLAGGVIVLAAWWRFDAVKDIQTHYVEIVTEATLLFV